MIMDYKEKYEMALAKCKAYIDDTQKRWSEEFCKATEEVFFEIFPELQENEDERIIKAQLDYWRSVGGKEWHGVPVQETIAWLEKQGEKPQVDDFDAELNALLKKYEHTWSEEDEAMMNNCIGAIHIAGRRVTNSYTAKDKKKMENWLKSLKQRIGGQQ